jgi:hypothetical protein
MTDSQNSWPCKLVKAGSSNTARNQLDMFLWCHGPRVAYNSFFFKLLFYWGYIVTFTKVFIIYHSWILGWQSGWSGKSAYLSSNSWQPVLEGWKAVVVPYFIWEWTIWSCKAEYNLASHGIWIFLCSMWNKFSFILCILWLREGTSQLFTLEL